MNSIKDLGIKSTDAFSKASYWDNNGAYQKQGDKLYKKLVPAEGAAKTLHGELIRGINRLFYEYCNNGNCNAIINDFEEIDYYYGKFIDLIEDSLCDVIYPWEVRSICSDIREVIKDAAHNIPYRTYFSEENMNKYNRMCDVVIWYVLNTKDRKLPTDYIRE